MARTRRTKAKDEKAILPRSRHPSLGAVESQPGSSNPTLGNVELQRENGSRTVPVPNSVKPSTPKKRTTSHTSTVRRSKRVQCAITRTLNQDIAPVIEEITLIETNDEYDPPRQEEQCMPEVTERTSLAKKNVEQNLDYIVQRLEAQEKSIAELKSKVFNASDSSGSPFGADDRYRSLYLESEEKLEDFAAENKQLSTKLETALTKLQAAEDRNHVFFEMLGKSKDVIMFSNLSNATETAVNMLYQALHVSPQDVGRGARSAVDNRGDPAARGKGRANDN